MIKHYITKYEEDGKLYAESWIQINIFGRCYCISRRKVEMRREKIKKEIVKKVNAVSNINEVEKTVAELSELIKKANSTIEELAEMRLKVELEIE